MYVCKYLYVLCYLIIFNNDVINHFIIINIIVILKQWQQMDMD